MGAIMPDLRYFLILLFKIAHKFSVLMARLVVEMLFIALTVLRLEAIRYWIIGLLRSNSSHFSGMTT